MDKISENEIEINNNVDEPIFNNNEVEIPKFNNNVEDPEKIRMYNELEEIRMYNNEPKEIIINNNYSEPKEILINNNYSESNFNRLIQNINENIANAYFESEIDSSNNVTKLNFINDINKKIYTPNNFLINNYKNFLNSKGIFIIKININKLEDYIIKHLKTQMIDIEQGKNNNISGSYNSIDNLKRKQELMKNYNNDDVYNFFNLNKQILINTSIKIIRLSSIFGFYTIMKENSIQTSPPTSITIIIPKILFENDTDFLNFLFDNYIPFFIPLETSSFARDRMNIYKKNIKNIFNGFNNGFNNAINKEIRIINTINIILNIIMKIFITRVLISNYEDFNRQDSFIDFLAEIANEFVSIIPDTQCYFNQDNYLEFNPGICTSIKYPQQTCPEQTCSVQTCPVQTCPVQTCPVQTCPKNNNILYVGIIGGIIVLLIIIIIVISMRGNKSNTDDGSASASANNVDDGSTDQ